MYLGNNHDHEKRIDLTKIIRDDYQIPIFLVSISDYMIAKNSSI
jgi:hypothetical protein